ncbi:hypothetical protein [Algirhabdus cladophorae]|uniref:hypothetical protein n=1 Tax=Algirhabdus cladophorae TaxID=3377108 RepID=UPI003B848097
MSDPLNPSASENISLHIGAHKTATTHLQHNLRRQRSVLRDNGIAFYGPRDLRSAKLDVRGRLGIGRASDEDPAKVFAALKGDAARLVLSDENWIAKAHPPSLPPDAPLYARATQYLDHFAQTAPQVQFDLFLAVRDYAPFYQSLYSQMFYGGEFISLPDYMAAHAYEPMTWCDPVRALTALPNVASLTLWRYEDYRTVAPRILSSLLGEVAAKQITLNDTVRHGGLSQRAAAELLQLGAPAASGARRVDKKLKRQIAAEVASKFPAGEEFPKISIWNAADLAASKARYAQDLEVISTMPKVTILWV